MKKIRIVQSIVLICPFLIIQLSVAQDYKSKVPKFTFSRDILEQENELKTNPLIIRMAESRARLVSDKWRPLYHYVNPEGNLNDPNGLCFWKGNWHLFYQAYPPEDTRQHWGHAVSKDLIHWIDLPYAIYPDPERAVFSGSTLAEDNRVIAIYHGTLAGNMVAISSDPLLLNWEKVTGNAVIPLQSNSGFTLPYSVFDPCIWKKDSIYYSLSAGRVISDTDGKPVRANFLFRSKDLTRWEYLHEFVENDRFTLTGDDGACPYFWPLGDKYILNFFSHMSGGQYILGDYDKKRDKLVAISSGKYNHGSVGPAGVHAPSASPDGKGGVIIMFNMNPGRNTLGWNQVMSLPRQLSLLPGDIVGQEPAGDYQSLRYDYQNTGPMILPANKEIVLKDIQGNSMEIIAEFEPGNAQMFELNVLRSPDRKEYTRIIFYKEKGFSKGLEYTAGKETSAMPADLLALYTGIPVTRRDRSMQSLISIESAFSSCLPDTRFRPPETAAFRLDPGENVKLHVFLDKSIVEVFVNGKECVAMRVYPDKKESLGISARAHGEPVKLISLQAWKLKTIYH